LISVTAYAFLLHKLTSNIELDFIVVAGYAAAAMQLPQLQSLQWYLQSNVLAFFKAASDIQPPPDLPPPNVMQIPAPQPQANQVNQDTVKVPRVSSGG